MVKGYDPSLLEPDVRTGKADACALEPSRERHAEIHPGSRRRCIGPLVEAGYTSPIGLSQK
jgi:hypothetical protein